MSRFLCPARGFVPSAEHRQRRPGRWLHRSAQTRRETPWRGVVRAAAKRQLGPKPCGLEPMDGRLRSFSEERGWTLFRQSSGTTIFVKPHPACDLAATPAPDSGGTFDRRSPTDLRCNRIEGWSDRTVAGRTGAAPSSFIPMHVEARCRQGTSGASRGARLRHRPSQRHRHTRLGRTAPEVENVPYTTTLRAAWGDRATNADV